MGTRNLIGFACCAVVAVGCFRVVDLDGYREAPPLKSTNESGIIAGATGDFVSLRVSFVAMKPHSGQMIEFRVVDAQNFIQSRGVISSMVALDNVINVPLAVPKPNAPYHLDFYADVNFSGGYDGLGSVLANDHAWRIDPLADYPEGIEPIGGLIQVRFLHNTSFTDINQFPSGTANKARDTGLGAVVHVRGLGALQGKMAQIRIVDRGSHHVVATYRVPEIHGDTFDAKVEGCLEQGTDYDIDLYVDSNGNGTYEDPSKEGGDLGFRAGGTCDEAGLETALEAGGEGKIDVGEP